MDGSTSAASRVDAGGLVSRLYRDMGLQGEVPAKRPNRRGELTRERIVAAATECFSEYGYTRTRISDVVHRAGTAQGNFYRHFESLDDLFLAVIRPGLEELATSPSRRREGGAGSGDAAGVSGGVDLAALVESNTAYLHTYARHRHILRLLREAAAASPNSGFQDLWLRLRGDFVGRTRHWLGRLAADGRLGDLGADAETDLDLLAEALGCLTEQLAYVHVGLPSATPRRERIDELGRSLGEAWFKLLRPLASS